MVLDLAETTTYDGWDGYLDDELVLLAASEVYSLQFEGGSVLEE
jgi:hypothetical protein